MPDVAHLDDLPRTRWTFGHIDGTWTYVSTEKQGGLPSRRAGCRRCVAPHGAMPVPVHQHLGAEEVFVVLGGDGLAYERDGDGERAYAVSEGDVIVRRANLEAHAFVAGPGGLDVLAYGPSAAPRAEVFPRIGVVRLRERWLEIDAGVHPWEREAALGLPELPAPSAERPARYVRAEDVRAVDAGPGVEVQTLGEPAGAVDVGVRRIVVRPDHADGPRRAHSAVERLVLVRGGSGHVQGAGDTATALRAGSVVGVRAGTGEAWRIVAGPDGLDLIDLCVLDAADMIHLPDSGELLVPALGVAVPARALDP